METVEATAKLIYERFQALRQYQCVTCARDINVGEWYWKVTVDPDDPLFGLGFSGLRVHDPYQYACFPVGEDLIQND